MVILCRVALLALVAALCGCTAGSATPVPSSAQPTAPTAPPSVITPAPATSSPTMASTPVPTPPGPFHSPLYGYVVTSPDWTGTAATTEWDGTGSPGDGDPFVDTLIGPTPHTFAVGVATKATLDEYAATSRTVGSTLRGCPLKPDTTKQITIGGAAAILDTLTCGVFVQTAYVVRAGRAYAFVMYDQPGNEAAERVGFEGLLKAVSFEE